MVADFIPRKSAASTKAYFARADVEVDGQAVYEPIWVGKGCERLGVEGEASRKEFNRLVDNKHPLTGEQLTPRQRADRVAALEVCFGPPKSVSLAIEYDPDGKLVHKALVDAILDTTRDGIEPLAAVRVRKGGKYEDRETGNVAGVLHMHGMARPVKGTPMPHHHGHLVLGNVTWDAAEGKHKALKQHTMMKNAPALEQMFHRKLRENLHAIGYRTKGEGRNWEIVGVSRGAIEKFSERRGVIQKFKEKVKTHKRDYAGLMTREPKAEHYDLAELRKDWDSRLSDSEKAAFKYLRARPKVNRAPEFARPQQRHLAFMQKVASIFRGLTKEKEAGIERW